MQQFLYRQLAKHLTATPERVDRLIDFAKKHPYSHLGDYMGRWWVFNPYHDKEGNPAERNWLMRQLVSARIHHIRRPDADRHLHDHPWHAQRIVLRGWYTEEVEEDSLTYHELTHDTLVKVTYNTYYDEPRFERTLFAGDTKPLKAGEFHRITEVSDGGVFTLFITGKWQKVWGFQLDDRTFVPHKEYFAQRQAEV